MLKRFSLNYILFSMFLDTFLVVGSFLLATLLRITLPYGLVPFNPEYPEGLPPLTFYVLIPFLWLITAFAVSLYDPRKSYKVVDEFQALTLAGFFFSLIVAGTLYFSFRQVSRVLILYAFALVFISLIGWRVMARAVFRLWSRHHAGINRVVIAGAGVVGHRVAAMIREYQWMGLELVGYLDDDLTKKTTDVPILGTLDDVEQVVTEYQVRDVVLALPQRAHERINMVVARLHELPVNVRIIPDYFSLALYQAKISDFGGIPMISLRDPALNDYQRMLKRIFDLVFGSMLMLLALPLMVVIAVAIKLDSPGPIFFRQKRVGENGRLFNMLKFRSMVENAEALRDQVVQVDEEGHVIHKVKDDPRVTRVGKFIRRWSLDELPQFFNVLRGDISLVGPRPELPWLVEEYELWQRKRFAVPQGITGWWQVNGRSDKMMHLHTDEDLYYIQNYSLWLDIYIIIKTPWVVLKGQGAF